MNHARKRTFEQLWKPGDAVEESGVYDVIHSGCRSDVKDAIFIGGQQLPSCRICGPRVRFRLRQAVPYIYEDRDFEK